MLLVILAGALAYAPLLDNGFLNLDDAEFITENPRIPRGLTVDSIRWAFTADVFEDSEHVDYWQPVTLVSRLIDGSLFGLNPRGHHLTNLLIHLANAALLLVLLASATGRLWRSAAVALIFATHPIHVSSVAWVAERKDVLSAFFSLLALAAFAQFAAAYKEHLETGTAGRTGGRVIRWYLLLAGGYALCLMSKPMALPLPVAMLLAAIWPIPRDRRPGLGRLALALAPLLLLSAAAVFLYTRVGHAGAELDLIGFQSPFALAGSVVSALAAYPTQLLFPVNLLHIYSVHPGEPSVRQLVGSLLLLGGFTAVATASARRRPYLMAGWLWYLISLLPVMALFQSNGAAGRFSYVPLLGVTVMLIWGLSELADERARITRAIATTVVTIALVFLTRAECRHWRNSVTLFSHLLELDPKHHIAHRNLGIALAEAGDYGKALEHFRAALAERPAYPSAYHNIGVAMQRLGRLDEAVRSYAEAVQLQPSYVWSLRNLAGIYLGRGEHEAALAAHLAILKTKPRDTGSLGAAGRIYGMQGRFELATDFLGRALEIDPNNPRLMNDLGVAAQSMGESSRAEVLFRRALAIDPDERFAAERLEALRGDD